jgi:5'-deoxynucleotidase
VNLVKTFELVSAMSDVRRFSLIRLAHQENVMEHTAFVSLVGLLLAIEINAICPGSVDLGAVALNAAAHDMDETVTGDIPRPTKYFSAGGSGDVSRASRDAGLARVIIRPPAPARRPRAASGWPTPTPSTARRA